MEIPSAEMKIWLFDLAHGNLEDSEILSGFIRYYILQGFSVSHVVNDIVYRTAYGIHGVQTAKSSLFRVLQDAASQDKGVKA